jgi:hypothetical protein
MRLSLSRAAALLALAALTSTAACASGGTASAGGEAAPSTRRANRDLLTRAELEGGVHTNLYDAVRALRPHWFRAAASTSGSPRVPGGTSAGTGLPTVMLEGQAYGNVESLRNITASTVLEARYRSVSEAQGKYGMRIATPVIEVTLIKGR